MLQNPNGKAEISAVTKPIILSNMVLSRTLEMYHKSEIGL